MPGPDLRTHLQATLGDAYVLERELGGGGMSRVFIAEDATLKRRVVVKVLPLEMAAEVSIARFEREIALAARLQHPHIVPLLFTGETQGVPYYAMPYVEGETLRDRLARGGELPVVEAVRLLREIATALGYAHDKGVVHRDIKPENVLLSGGVALVTDFGVAKALLDSSTSDRGPLTGTGVSVGTPAYMSPEQVSADPGVDHRADLYAFGMIAYEMLAGQSPFAGRTAQALLAAHVIDAPEPLQRRRPAVPPALAALVMRCLEKRPADRPQNASEIVHALDVVTTPTQTFAPRRAPSRRMRVAVVAATLVVIASGAVWWRFGRNAPAATTTQRLLVAPFENLTGDARYDHIGRMAADRISQLVAQVGSIDVVPSNMVLMSLRDTTGGQAARLETLSRATHAGLLMSGSVVLRGDSLVLQAQVMNVRSGKVAIALVPVAGPVADPIAAMDALGDRLLGALRGSRAMAIVSAGFGAPKYAAYQQFADGYERFVVHGDVIGSRPFFERAIAIDSTYTQAYQLLARQYIFAREFDRADSMAHRIERLPHGLTAVERLQLEYMKADLAGDFAGQLRAQQQLVAKDSNALALALLGEAAMGMLRPDLAVPAYESAEPAMLNIGGFTARGQALNQSEAYHEAGMHDRELRFLAATRSLFPDPMFVHGRQLRVYAGLARPQAALALADTMVRAGGDSAGRILLHLATAAAEFRAHGDTTTASRLLATARRWIAANAVPAPRVERSFFEGITLLASGMPDSAIVRLARVGRDSSSFDAAGYLALAQAARGDRAAARATADSLGALHRRWLYGENTFWRAAIMGALDERDLAVQLLQQAHREGRPMQSWHYHGALSALHGYPAFDALVRPHR